MHGTPIHAIASLQINELRNDFQITRNSGLSVSWLVGLIFGMAPAYRASRMDPVEALRYE